MTIQLVDLKKQYESIKTEIDAVISEVLSKTAFIGGSYVKDFEEAFARFCGVTALHRRRERHRCPLCRAQSAWASETATKSSCPANSFIATAEAVTQAGARVVFADIDPGRYNIDVDEDRREDHAENEGHHPRASLRSARRHGCHPGPGRESTA